MKDEYTIMGFFWRQEYGKPYPFTGRLEIKNDGIFEGEVRDEFGRASISGQVKKNILVFTKKYRPGSVEATKPINYVLGSVKRPTDGGWNGTGAVQQPDGTTTIWQTACIIFPR